MKLVLTAATAAVWLAVLPGTGETRTWLSQAPPAWQEVKAPSVVAQAVRLRNHLNGMLTGKCRGTYTRHLEGTSLRTWVARHLAAHRAKNLCTTFDYADRDFHSSLRLASRIYRVSYAWLHNCDHDEGSDRMVWNHGGSGAFGPMQFMWGTFYSNVGAAFGRARERGFRVPSRYAQWDSNVGQAFTAADMFSRGWSSHWTGARC